MKCAFLDHCCTAAKQVTVLEHDETTLRQMLEYIYTNRVKDMPGLSADEVIKLLALANGECDPRRLVITTGVVRLSQRVSHRTVSHM